MSDTTQISVSISHHTRERLDHISKTRGIRKNHLVEQALSSFLDQIETTDTSQQYEPVKLTPSQLRRLHELLDAPAAQPTQALRELIARAKDMGSPNIDEFLTHEPDTHEQPRTDTTTSKKR